MENATVYVISFAQAAVINMEARRGETTVCVVLTAPQTEDRTCLSNTTWNDL